MSKSKFNFICKCAAILTVMLAYVTSERANATPPAPPTITPLTGVFNSLPATVTIAAAGGTTIRYTVDGTQAGIGSTLYSAPFTMPAYPSITIRAVAISGVDVSNESISYIYLNPNAVGIPRTDLKLWCMPGFGMITTSGALSTWVDLSNSTNDCTQSNSSNRPGLQANSINGYFATTYNGSSHYLDMATGLANLTGGCSMFVVCMPKSSGSGTIAVTGNSGPSNMVTLETNGTQSKAQAYNGSTASSLTSPSSSVTQNKYQLLEFVHNGSTTGTLYVNGKSVATGTLQSLVNTARTNNHIGSDLGASAFWQGEIAEILLYQTGLTAGDRAAVESYLIAKYQLLSGLETATPIISVAAGTLPEPMQVAIAARGDAKIYATTDGSTPTTSSPPYVKPLYVAWSQTVKAIAVSNGISSSVASAAYTLDSSKWPAPDAGDTRALQIDLTLPTTSH